MKSRFSAKQLKAIEFFRASKGLKLTLTPYPKVGFIVDGKPELHHIDFLTKYYELNKKEEHNA